MTKYLSFKGTATRSEYWGVTVIITLVYFFLIVLGTIAMGLHSPFGIMLGGFIILAATVMYIWYFLTVTVKRCRDADINTWWTAACFIPYVGVIPWIVFGCLSSVKKEK